MTIIYNTLKEIDFVPQHFINQYLCHLQEKKVYKTSANTQNEGKTGENEGHLPNIL